MSGTAILTNPFSIPSTYSLPAVVTVDDVGAFPEGACCVIPTTGLQPYVGQVTLTSEAFHCDGGVASFSLWQCGTTEVGYHTRIQNAHSGAFPSSLIILDDVSSDHSYKGISFEDGAGATLMNSLITATRSQVDPAVYVGPNFGGGAIVNNDIGNNGAGPGITVECSGVLIEANRLRYNATGIVVTRNSTGDVQIVANTIGANTTTALDLSQVQPGSDRFTVVGNVFPKGLTTPIALPSPVGNLGTHSRVTNNTGYNPVSATAYGQPALGASGAFVFNPFLSDAMVVVAPGTTPVTQVQVKAPDGTTTIYAVGSFITPSKLQVFVPCGYSIAVIYGVTPPAPAWSWLPT